MEVADQSVFDRPRTTMRHEKSRRGQAKVLLQRASKKRRRSRTIPGIRPGATWLSLYSSRIKTSPKGKAKKKKKTRALPAQGRKPSSLLAASQRTICLEIIPILGGRKALYPLYPHYPNPPLVSIVTSHLHLHPRIKIIRVRYTDLHYYAGTL